MMGMSMMGMRVRALWITALVALITGPSAGVVVLPGTPLRELAEKRGLLFGTDILDSWPEPFSTDQAFKSIASRQFNFGNWDWCTQWPVDQPHGPEGGFNFDCFDAVVPFFRAANMTVRTNGILASAHNSTFPAWLLDGIKSKNFSQQQVRFFLENRTKTVVPHWLSSGLPFNGMIAVNEAFWNQDMTYKYGPMWPHNWVFGPDMNIFSWAFDNSTDWFAQTFAWAREAADGAGFPQLPLFYNDYGIETASPKADAVLRFLSEQLKAGTPIDGIGFQAHLQCNCVGCNESSVISANMQRFIKLGLKVWVTELDVAMAPGCTQDMQASVYSAVLEACLANAPHCNSFMLWGFTDRFTWLDNKTQAPNILDAEYRPKPAYFALQKALSEPEKSA